MDFNNISHLIAEKIRIKSNMQSRNHLVSEFRENVKRINERDVKRLLNLQTRINQLNKK
jgi:ubiquinone biosynthesis protein UbiJ